MVLLEIPGSSSSLQGAQGLVLTVHYVVMASPTQLAVCPENPERGRLCHVEEIQEGFSEKVTSELDLEG